MDHGRSIPRLKPFFGYFGSKWRMASKYPLPRYPKIIEPFAGSAGYSLLHHSFQEVLLNDSSKVVSSIWDLLINMQPGEVESLPDDIREDMSPAQKALIGFWFAKASPTPRNQATPWAAKYPMSSWWGEKIRKRIERQAQFISHWEVRCGSYLDLDDEEATWFIDPPYEKHGSSYPEGSKGFDYGELSEWCKSRRGQVIVCEGTGATWLPFQPFTKGKRSTGTKAREGPSELIWLNDFEEIDHDPEVPIPERHP